MSNPTDETRILNQETPSEPAKSKISAGAPNDGGILHSWKAKFGHKALVFCILALVALVLYTVANMPAVTQFFQKFLKHTSAIIIGAIIAYLCNPILKFYEFKLFKNLKRDGLRRGLSLFLVVVTLILLLALIIMMILPQLVESITELFNNIDTYLRNTLNYLDKKLPSLLDKLPGDIHLGLDVESATPVSDWIMQVYNDRFPDEELTSIESLIQKIKSDALNWITKKVVDNYQQIMDTGMKTLGSMFTSFKDLFLGLFIAFYILASKEKRIAQVKKFRRAIFSEEQDRKVGAFATIVDKSFGGFISGKLIDSLIIGILTFLLLTIFRISPYNGLISIFIGVTNVIPVFGPFIGAIPSFLIVLISSPSKAILFLVLVLVIQQLDGNVIGPKILGDNTGVSSLAVITSITFCGSLWGVTGMLIGVPLFTVIIKTVKEALEVRLLAKEAPTDTVAYYPKDALSVAERDVYYEHAGLRYRYEHSKLKGRVDACKASIIKRFKKK